MTSKVIYDLLFRTYEDYKFLGKFSAENRLVTNRTVFQISKQKSKIIGHENKSCLTLEFGGVSQGNANSL